MNLLRSQTARLKESQNRGQRVQTTKDKATTKPLPKPKPEKNYHTKRSLAPKTHQETKRGSRLHKIK
jgi:hypothetical protein